MTAMRKAIARADVGDEQCGQDPTVRALGERVADLLGHVPTGAVTSRVFTGYAGWIDNPARHIPPSRNVAVK